MLSDRNTGNLRTIVSIDNLIDLHSASGTHPIHNNFFSPLISVYTKTIVLFHDYCFWWKLENSFSSAFSMESVPLLSFFVHCNTAGHWSKTRYENKTQYGDVPRPFRELCYSFMSWPWLSWPNWEQHSN